jgi:hypothetical protein
VLLIFFLLEESLYRIADVEHAERY